jgi:two-component system, NarL family, sensor histidine kinase UhpB
MVRLPELVGNFSRSDPLALKGEIPLPSGPLSAVLRPPRSLRSRVLLAVGATFALSLVAGGVGAGLRARDSLRDELQAALDGARQSAAEPFGDLARSDHATRDLVRFVQSFDGSRHILATAIDGQGRVLQRSRPQLPLHPAPDWFVAWMRPPAMVQLVPGGDGRAGSVRLEALSAADAADAWSELARMVAAFAAFSVVGGVLIHAVIGAALRPLAQLSQAFGRIGDGDYGAHVPARGVTELAALGRGFNTMAERLADIDRRNRSLEAQLLTLQDEERAEIARDLHDEIGPYLFAVSLDASLAGRLARTGRIAEAEERLASITAAVDHMQRQVRDMLNQLRPTPEVDLGLPVAIADAVAFWREKRPDITFSLSCEIGDEAVEPRQAEALWRVTQEALSNAVRHGRPMTIGVELSAPEPGRIRVRVEDDGGAGPAEPRAGSGFGLRGMRERMVAARGDLRIDAAPGRGWTVEAVAPARGPGYRSDSGSDAEATDA